MEILGFKLWESPEVKILKEIDEHMNLCLKATEKLLEAVECTFLGRDAEKSIKKVTIIEANADDIRRGIVRELSEGILPPMNKEDLIRLTWKQDKVANWAKESAEILRLLKESELSEELVEAFVELATLNIEGVRALQDVLKLLFDDWKQAVEKCKVVEDKETDIDLQYQRTLELLMKSNLDAGTLMIANELARTLENLGDDCEDTSDLMKVVAISTFR